MGKDAKIEKALAEFGKPPVQTFTAEVVSVDKMANTIDVKDTDDFDLDEVRLTAVIDNSKSVVLYPKIGSSVLISKLGDGDHLYYVSSISEVESVEGTIDKTTFKIDADGYVIEKDGENLKDVLSDIIGSISKLSDEVSKIMVLYGTTPNIPAITQIKTELETGIKNRLNTILK